nr:NADH dehydrogenase (ubiquinone) Fe-S protein 2 [Ipomoea batatas]
MCKTLPRESLSQMRIKKVFGQDKKGTRPLTPRDKSGLLAMTWESMREGSRTRFRPNRAQSQNENGFSRTRYEINDLKDRCREKLLDFFIALRREIEDEDFLTQCGHWMEKTDKGTTHRKGIPQGAPISPGKDLSARSRPMDRKKNAGKANEI